MQVIKESFKNNLFIIRRWEISNPLALVLIVRSYCEYSVRFQETATLLNNAGYSVFSYDRGGEGNSQSKCAVFKDLAELIQKLN